ncbi:ThiF family adenylyltransferase [Micrococcus luteus]
MIDSVQGSPASSRPPRVLEDLEDTQLERFARQLTLDGFGPEAQLALLRSRVLVVGAGGLGSPVLAYLAAAGVGEIHVVDDDAVDRSNLHRQVIHGESTLGEPKTASAAARMRDLHPQCRVVEHRVRLTAENALQLVSGMDLVVDGADTYGTRYLVADACEIAGVPVVWGAILRFAGQLSFFAPGHTRYRDVFPEEPEPGEVPTCAAAGVIGVLPGIVGSLMAAEAIKHLSGVGETLTDRLLTVDALTLRFTTLALAPDPARTPVTDLSEHQASPGPGCVAVVGKGGQGQTHGPAGTTTAPGELDPAALAALLADPEARAGLTLVDVRQGWERRVDRIDAPESVADRHLPLDELLDAPDRLGLDGAETVVLWCASGVRSARAREALVDVRPDAAVRLHTLAGGLEAWRQEDGRPSAGRTPAPQDDAHRAPPLDLAP